MRKLLVCATLLLLAAAQAFGQENDARAFVQEAAADAKATPSFLRLGDVSEESARLLKSQGNRERAWGAYLVGAN